MNSIVARLYHGAMFMSDKGALIVPS